MTNTMNDHEQSELYNRLKAAFLRHPGSAIDLQTEFAEMLQIVQTVGGPKPSFFAIAETHQRKQLFDDVLDVVRDLGCAFGAGPVDVHHRHRPLNIRDERIGHEVRAKLPVPVNAFWITRDVGLAASYAGGNVASIGYTALLGYPDCCAAWHYDCYFARGIEAFCDVYLAQMPPADICAHLRSEWVPSSGWFLPQPFYLAGVLRGNLAFPFLEHVACPRCLSDRASQSSALNASYSALGGRPDPERHRAVAGWAGGIRTEVARLIEHPRRTIERALDELRVAMAVKASEAYTKHSRYLFKALGLAK